MKKIKAVPSKNLPPAKLYLDDIEEIHSILRETSAPDNDGEPKMEIRIRCSPDRQGLDSILPHRFREGVERSDPDSAERIRANFE